MSLDCTFASNVFEGACGCVCVPCSCCSRWCRLMYFFLTSMPWISRERVALHHNGERATDIINTVLNDVKCSKASNNLCIIHDPCVTILLLFQGTFPPVFFCFLFFFCAGKVAVAAEMKQKNIFLWKQQRNRWMLKTVRQSQSSSRV